MKLLRSLEKTALPEQLLPAFQMAGNQLVLMLTLNNGTSKTAGHDART